MNSVSDQTALQRIFRSPLYLAATIAMFLSGLGTSAAAPQIVLFLHKELDVSLPFAGMFYLTNLMAPVAGYLVGSYSDRIGDRLGLFRLCALAGFVGWAAIALATSPWIPFAVSAVVLGFSGAAASQIFAALHDDVRQTPRANDDSVVAIVRMALTAGWVLGPVVGAWIANQYGLRAMLWVTASCFLFQLAPFWRMRVSRKSEFLSDGSAHGASKPDWQAMVPLLTFTGLFVLVYAGESIKYGFLLLYLEEQLEVGAGMRGAVIGIQPLVELLIMPFSVPLARKFGMMRLMAVAASCGVLANICFALWPDIVGMFFAQTLMGIVWGVFAALGIIVAQRLLPQAVATASAIFMSSSALSSALGGLAGGVGVATLGLPYVFLLPAAFAAIAAVGLLAMSRTRSSGHGA